VSEPDNRDGELPRDVNVPPRWLDEAEGVPDDLVQGLRALRNQRPSAARLALIAAPFGLSPSAGAEAVRSSSTTAATAPSSSGALVAKILGVTLATGGLGLAAWLALSGRATTRPDHANARDSVSVVAPPAPPDIAAAPRGTEQRESPHALAGAAQPPATQPDRPEETAAQTALPQPPVGTSSPTTRSDTPSTARPRQAARAPAPSAPPARNTTTYERPAEVSDNAQLSETQLLAQARSAEPARALALAEEHARRFPASGFAQEREYVIITALLRAGDRSAAEQRAQRFARSYPKSPYLARLQSLLPAALEAD